MASTLTTPTLDSTPRAGTRSWIALAVLMLPVLLISVDNTVLSFAIPSISLALTPSASELLWIIDIYPLVLAALLVPMGSMTDRFGRRKLLLIGSTGFAVVSAFAAFAPTAGALIGYRALLGLFGAMLMPATLSLIRNLFLHPAQRRTAIAIWAAGFSGGAALGPIVGGFILEHFWWGAVFLMSVPVLVPLLILAPIFVPESKDPNPGRIDVWSILLSFGAMVPAIFGIKEIAQSGFSLLNLGLIVVGVALAVVFVRRQMHRADPMMDVSLFKNPVFSGSVSANLLSIFALVGFLYFITQHLQLVVGLSPTTAAYVLVPGLAITVVCGLLAAKLANHFRPSHLVVAGLLLNATAFLIVFLNTSGSVMGIIIAFAVLGAGVGTAETISNDLILSAAPPAKAGAASAISETAYEVGSVLGTAVLGSILAASYRMNVTVPAGVSAAGQDTASQTLGGAIEVAGTLPAEQGQALLESAKHAFDSGSGTVALVSVVLMLAAAVMCAFALRTAVSAPEPVDH
ncbi:DHA2 family multidrug resistance protein-like MFS transporter [Arthrobacter stackebrandtii]|uniref:DHA2 family multidrug resistance protein-like MFS transporter n=1 Tax=Arthrobacter stackebrandtii TaxID=272161 RepID=A0ABS4YXS2_9MICC|nr:MFS transporter [Arthrobacter stackebrandtii]MBP2413255.1 DHA2 family multidrug resistance protein-like MFS transporter [Arthrobacter stackebrandtii]PYH01002.1 MFS transporter [Arthrobacter stackebrandtii]